MGEANSLTKEISKQHHKIWLRLKSHNYEKNNIMNPVIKILYIFIIKYIVNTE